MLKGLCFSTYGLGPGIVGPSVCLGFRP